MLSESRAGFIFDCGKFFLQGGLDSLFPAACKLCYNKMIGFMLCENFIRLFHGPALFFRKCRDTAHWVVLSSFFLFTTPKL